ncbi:response regulator transcription factor [Vibrio harveyi]|uniref:response regulator transcription factor n=1 Tax=Vibrio harveyi TaxID=669 RepID=UPI000349397F|nr:response regulator transcription factor [Vibrio harveyi]GEA23634.1 transcriptional activator protein PfeR [Vibrio harveyi]
MFSPTSATSTSHQNWSSSAPSTVPSILLVEDDPDLNLQLTELLKEQGYNVSSMYSGDDGVSAFHQQTFDLVILDVNLPNLDGFEVLNVIRSQSQTPVVMLTAYGAEEYRIQGLKCGADDYITKPCNFTEVSLRVEAILRRTQLIQQPNSATKLSDRELLLSKQTHSVTLHHRPEMEPVQLTPIQFKLLWTLIEHRGEVLSKPFLYQTVLERQFSQYDRALDMHLSRVRKRLIAEGMSNDRIQTVHGKGYIFK